MKNFVALSFLVVLSIVSGFGCRTLSVIGAQGNYLEGNNAQTAVEKVKSKIGKPFSVINVTIEDNEITMQVRDPYNPQNLDQYKIADGFVSGPEPIRLNAMQKDLDKTTFPFDEINFAAIPEFTRDALQKAKIENATVSSLEFGRSFAITLDSMGATGDARWMIEIVGARETASAVATPDGKLLGVDLSHTSRAANYTVITPEELKKAQDALKNSLGENVQLGEIVINPEDLSFSVEGGEDTRLADGYQFGINGLTKTPFDKPRNTMLPIFKPFSLSEIDLSKAADYVEQAKQRIEMPESEFASMKVSRKRQTGSRDNFQIEWTVNFAKGRNINTTVTFDNGGNVLQITKNGKTVLEEKGA